MLNRRRFIAGAGAAIAGSTIGSTAAGAAGGDDEEVDNEADDSLDDRATIVAHRGFADTYPENTVAAFELASHGSDDNDCARGGADWVELDVHPTADGDIAVFHDEELGSLTDTEGVVYETSSDEVFSAEVLESGQTVPTLEEAMEAVASDVGVNIDVKAGSHDVEFGRVDDPEDERDEWEWLETVVETAEEYDNELLFSTFWEGALAAVRDIAPDVPAAYLLDESIEEGLEVTDEYDAEAIHPPMEMISDTPFFDDEAYEEIDLVEEARDRDIPLNVWTVDTWYEAEQLLDAGVDGLIVDYPGIVCWGQLDDGY